MNKNLFNALFISSSIIFSSNALAHSAAKPDDVAPIGIMGNHTHHKGMWMTSYRNSRMEMSGNRSGTSDVSTNEVLSNYMVSPQDMSMEMHMFGLMYGATDKLTIMGMLPYVEKSMNHVNRMGVNFKTETEGLGDIKLSGIYNLLEKNTNGNKQNVTVNFGISFPTGATDERGNTPAGNNQKLPYPMQLGSGTYDPILKVTYLSDFDKWSWGSQLSGIFRFGKNDEGYRLGNEYGATAWVARQLNKVASVSFRLDGQTWNDIEGQDNDLNPMMVPTARTDLRAGDRIDALVGVNLYKSEGKLAGNRLAAEFGMPVYQDLDGPQLETNYKLTLGWQLMF